MSRCLSKAKTHHRLRSVVAICAQFLLLVPVFGLVEPPPRPGHYLTLLPNGQMAGWGVNDFAQVQAEPGDPLPAPVRLDLPGTRTRAVAVGSRHSLAVDETGKVWAWGDNSSGQLGLGHTRPVAGPTVVAGLPGRASVVVAGAQHSAVLLSDGSVWVWGANNRGQLGLGTIDGFAVQTRPARVPSQGRVVDLAAGHDFVLALVGQRDSKGAGKGAVWSWGAGNGVPHLVDGLQTAVLVRAAGQVAMARSVTGDYWQWRPAQPQPQMTQREVFDKLGEMTHPLLAAFAMSLPPINNSLPPDAVIKAVANSAKALASTTPAPTASLATRASPALLAGTPAVVSLIAPVAAPAVPLTAAQAFVAAPVPVSKGLPLPPTLAAAAPAAAPAAPVPASALARLQLAGTVRLSAGYGDSAGQTGRPLESVQMAAEGAQCSATDNAGRYVCSVAPGWSGRVTLRRANYRFSPSALSFQNLRTDAGQQDFAATYDPR